ncbi:MAG: hypothetical protein RBR77_16210 [Thauera sp.]|jgi:hypothetical protein|nr:hypothetical protein [Thauera sp.]
MSVKVTIYYQSESGVHLYEEMTSGDIQSPAYLAVDNPEECTFQHDINGISAMLCMHPDVMDDLAIAWCRHRKLQGALGGPVGREFGGPDSDYEQS